MPSEAPPVEVSAVRVDDSGIYARSDGEVILDVLFDERRIWSFHLLRDGTRSGRGYDVGWPGALTRFLDGTTRLQVAEHVSGRVLFDEEVRLGSGADRIAVVNDRGLPLGIDKSLRLAQTFDTRSAEHVAPLLDAVEQVLAALQAAGIDAFPAYGTLLGAVRGGRLIGHDSDADLGYVSRHTHPVDVVRESFDLQRALSAMGYTISRYSGAAFKVEVREGDGSRRGLDVFGGFLREGRLYLMGEIATPFREDWIFPLGETTLEGRTLPAPSNPEELLTATYGPSWRVPDPAYVFETPESTHRRLNGWFRGTRIRRAEWERTYAAARRAEPDLTPSDFPAWVRRRHGGIPARVVDLGCGTAADALWFARQRSVVRGLDYSLRGSEAVAAVAAQEGLALELASLNLLELRSVLAEGARESRVPGPKVAVARHLADATNGLGRHRLWRLSQMMLRGGGKLYLEFLVDRGTGDPFAKEHHLRTLGPAMVEREIGRHGGTVETRKILREDGTGRRACRMVVTWER